MIINTKRLRKDLMDNYGTAMINGFLAAVVSLSKIESMSDQELVEFALSVGIDLKKYEER